MTNHSRTIRRRILSVAVLTAAAMLVVIYIGWDATQPDNGGAGQSDASDGSARKDEAGSSSATIQETAQHQGDNASVVADLVQPSVADTVSHTRPRTVPKIEDQLTRGGQFQSDLATTQLIGDYQNLLDELRVEMGSWWQNEELAELYSNQIRSQMGAGENPSALSEMICGRKLCLAEITTPANGVAPKIPISSVLMGPYQSIRFEDSDGRVITRLLFVPPNS